MENDAFQLMDTFAKDIEQDTYIDLINLREKLLAAPGIKHKWLYKTMQQKKLLLKLEEQKEDLIRNKFSDNPIKVSKVALKNQAEQDTDIIKLTRQINAQTLLVEYMDRTVDKVFCQMGYDFTSLTNLIKREDLSM